MNLKDFSLEYNSKILDALTKIDSNKKGFVILTNSNKVCGVLTDGDIRRGLIQGAQIDALVSTIASADYTFVFEDSKLEQVVSLFQNGRITFLPIISRAGELKNIITRNSLHVLMLQNIDFDLSYDFITIDDNMLMHQIFVRPWGFYKTTILNDFSQSKIIRINPMSQLSLQSHALREEHWIILSGQGKIILDNFEKDVNPGTYWFIPKGCKHSLMNNSSSESLIIAEVQMGDYFGEDDIQRYKDIYGRV